MVTYKDIIDSYKAAETEAKRLEKKYNDIAEEQRQLALRHYRIAAQKMGKYEGYSKKARHAKWSVGWVNNLLKPLMEEVNKRTGLNFELNDLCAFGIFRECPVYAKVDGERTLSVTFNPSFSDKGLTIKTGRKTNTYPIGSIGDINGGNDESEDVTSVETVIENLQRRYPDLNIQNNTDYE